MMEIRRMEPADPGFCRRVAAIHMEEIHHGALPLLGVDLLASVYGGLAAAPRSGVATYRRVVLAGFPPLGGRLLARLAVSPALWRKLASLLSYARSEPESSGRQAGERSSAGTHAELLAMAVSAGAQGRGAGRALVESFDAAAREWGIDEYWVTTNIKEDGSNRFYRSLGFVPSGTLAHHDLTLQRYVRPISAERSSASPEEHRQIRQSP